MVLFLMKKDLFLIFILRLPFFSLMLRIKEYGNVKYDHSEIELMVLICVLLVC